MVETGRDRKLILRHLILLLGFLALLLADNHLAVAAPPRPTNKVLLLYSYQSVLPVNIEWDGAIRAALKGTDAAPTEFFTEFLDLAQFPDQSYLHSLINLLRDKYARRKIDLLMPMGDLAFHFLLAQRQSLFPGVPMVFCGAERHEVEVLKRPPATTGVVTWVDVQGTLAAALKLQPQTRQIALVGGISETDRVFQRLAQEALRSFKGQLEVISLTDLPLDQILARVANLPLNTITLYLSLFRDGAGNDFIPRDALGQVSQAAKSPVYGLWETLLGHGIVGGHLMSLKAQGSLAGELGRRVLNGEKPEDLPIVYEGTDLYLFDWRQLKRWGISEGDLPPGSTVRFKEPSLWEEHQREVIAIAAAFCLLGLLIIILLINLGQRRRAERSLVKRLEFETLTAELSAQFVNVSAGEVDREIDQGIKRLVEFVGVDRGHLWRFAGDQEEFVATHFWAAPGIAPMPQTPVHEHFPWIKDQLLNGRAVVCSQPEELPAEAQVDRQSLLASGIKSALCIPLAVGGRFIGALTLSTLQSHKVWPAGLAQELQPIGEIFANALIRGLADSDLRQAELKYHIVADFTYDWEYWRNLDGTLRYVSPSCERISGYRPEEFFPRPDLIRAIILPEDRELWDRHGCDSQEAPGPREIQFRIKRPDGTIRWIEHICQPVTGDSGELIGIRASNRDITERKQGELEIVRLREQLQADYSYLQEEIKLSHDFEHIIGNSNELKYVLHKVEQVAPSSTTVLILGETGTGKELIARAIHSSSPQRHRPLIKVDCASLSPTLIESELFGHEKGAFTGAQSRKIGRFELAHGSTIFLDEIGELPLELQSKLLRVVQEGEFERLGSSQTLKVDVRIIAATNRDLEEEVKQGRFREDLWYRLHVFPITVPPLRQRQEDIPLLVQSFVQRFSRKMGKAITKIPPEVMAALQQYPWPGNIRELENVIERALIDTQGPVLQLSSKIAASPSPAPSPDTPVRSLEAVERAHILHVLQEVNWKIDGKDGAAARLEINPSTLRSRLRKLAIVRK
jgi:PAS domain S-box-containing protein